MQKWRMYMKDIYNDYNSCSEDVDFVLVLLKFPPYR